MKFLLVVLGVHLLLELFNRRKSKIENVVETKSGDETIHPAEFRLRYSDWYWRF